MSSAGALPSLLVASLDLQLVRLLRDAINSDAAVSGLGPAPSDVGRRFRVEPEPLILPRRRVEPEPRVEPREVIRPADRYEPAAAAACDPGAVPPPGACYTPCPCTASKSPIEPPWKVLPWEERLPAPCDGRRPARPKVKVVFRPPDRVNKGSLLDLFI